MCHAIFISKSIFKLHVFLAFAEPLKNLLGLIVLEQFRRLT